MDKETATRRERRNKEYGLHAEQAAASWLACHGYIIRERNWSPRRGHKEIDIIAQRDDLLVFVEVKARSSVFIDPVSAVTPQKINKIVRAANSYLMLLPDAEADALGVRFDIVAMSGQEPDWEIDHIPDAFFPPLTTLR